MAPDPHTYIRDHLLNTKSLPVSEVWLSEFLSAQRPGTTPLAALTQTALFRLLASDFTNSLEIPSSNLRQVLPTDVTDPSIKERCISGPVPVQIFDIEDIGTSIWSQVEAIERIERGESIRGREVIRTVPQAAEVEEGISTMNTTNAIGRQSAPSASSGEHAKLGGPHRLILQDCKGTKVTAIELKPLDAIKIGETAIGTKLLITNAIVARGMALLDPECVTILGGKIEGLDSQWKAGRKRRLLSALNPPENTGSA
ncbi:hypothetical protein MGYG_05876 [Nannizzia gypsea CBS 118893]|uniref:RecQ-mediated genome instability protein 1 n=1 Tax=Arthroderma gypseum (strain ATCC MYA-4604 / CBS 118893) TaxID=535722 RepID=E4UZT8_ARTGP|nr:hypothetical protein MGYG_05876 [Nannizzia gypsea CBS 118893]EFR02875.1 hypothetical protein MGYG_05876 [Nannizzia gypsea CBS 118893]